jgi:hypothetical protein
MSFLRRIITKERLGVFLILVISNVILFWQFYFKGLLPFPGDLLVSYFFPWNSGGFAGFDPWTIHKDLNAADVLRQMYPWKEFAFNMIRQGQIPLWNPYNFSGYPLISNLQSSVFFPGNFVFLFLSTLWAWISLVIFLPLLFNIFTYLFLRSLKLSRFASIYGGIVMMNLSHISVWHEQLIITQTVLFIPLVLWLVNKFFETGKKIYFFLIPLFLGFCILGGHAQTVIYLYTIALVFMVYRKFSWKQILFCFSIAIGVAALQLIPTLEIYLLSAREGEATRKLFAPYVLPWKYLITIFVPDFFGNPATGNFWGRNYSDFQIFSGVSATAFAFMAIYHEWKKTIVKVFFGLSVFGLLFAMWPFAYVFHYLNVPIIATGVPARIILIYQISVTFLAAIGFNYWLENYGKLTLRKLIPVYLMGVIFVFIWIFVRMQNGTNFDIAERNTLLPTLMCLKTIVILTFCCFFPIKRLKYVLATVFILISSVVYSYFFNKNSPFAPAKFAFPQHRVFTFLQEQAGVDRFYGFGTAYVDKNFATYFGVYAPEGYDSLYIKRYGELLASTKDGKLPKDVLRSDAEFGSEDNVYRNRLFDLLGIKYILDKNDTPKSNWEPDNLSFPEDKYKLVWQSYKWKAYERKTVYPRAFVVSSYEVIKDKQKIISRFYDPLFNPRQTVILEENPGLPASSDSISSSDAKISSYSPNKVVVNVSSKNPGLLLLSDTYYPGWKAFINGGETKIFEADYSLRAVKIPGGKSTVSFVYDPLSFRAGLFVSLISVGIIFFGIIFVSQRNKKPS